MTFKAHHTEEGECKFEPNKAIRQRMKAFRRSSGKKEHVAKSREWKGKSRIPCKDIEL